MGHIFQFLFVSTVLREVKFVEGKAGASIRSTAPEHSPENAFKRDVKTKWQSGHNATGGGGIHYPFPHLIWYDFGERQIAPARVAITAGGIAGGPIKWEFIGSDDETCEENSPWTVLCGEWSGEEYPSESQIKFCDVTSTSAFFRCLGINVLETPCGSYELVQLSNIRMWENSRMA